jgi:hypothetical protein
MEGAGGVSMDVQLWVEGGRVSAGTMTVGRPAQNINWTLLSAVMRTLCSMATSHEQNDILVSLADIQAAAPYLIAFEQILQAALRLEFDPASDAPEKFTSLIYYFYADVSDHTFYTLVERPVHTDLTLDNGHRQLTCGLPTLIDRYILTNADEEIRKMMRTDYEGYLQKQEMSGTPAGLGDLHDVLKRPKAAAA